MHVAYDPAAHAPGPLQAIEPRCKILAFGVLLAAAVSVPVRLWQPGVAFLAAATLLLLLSRLPLAMAARRVLLMLPVLIALALVVPVSKAWSGPVISLWSDGPRVPQLALLTAWGASTKALTGLLLALVLGGTTGVAGLLEAFSRLGAPKVMVVTGAFMHRYAVTLMEELTRMKRAALSRGWQGRWLWQAGTLGRLGGALFLRSYERGERVWHGMLSRGWTGTFPGAPPRRMAMQDAMFLVWIGVAALGMRYAWGL